MGALRQLFDAFRFKMQVESAARLGGRGKGLKSLEFRTAPSENTQEIVDTLDAIGFAQIPTTTFSTADVRLGLLHQYLTRRDVFDRGHDLIWIETSREAEALGQLQAGLRERLASNGIVVEVNPTSNLLIGHLEDLSNHPLWRLRPPRAEAGDPPPVGVCIGSDDPITFNSNLRQEYQCLADALALGGLGDELATQWLERARQCGLDNRFTLKRIQEEPLRQLVHLES